MYMYMSACVFAFCRWKESLSVASALTVWRRTWEITLSSLERCVHSQTHTYTHTQNVIGLFSTIYPRPKGSLCKRHSHLGALPWELGVVGYACIVATLKCQFKPQTVSMLRGLILAGGNHRIRTYNTMKRVIKGIMNTHTHTHTGGRSTVDVRQKHQQTQRWENWSTSLI